MQKKTTGTAAASAERVVAAEVRASTKPDGCAAGFYCYIGPGITGVIQSGDIFRGTRTEALKAASAAIEKYPLVKTLIVSGDELPKAWQDVKHPGNALYANYKKIAAGRR